jgi:alanyl-tRNA synthetase
MASSINEIRRKFIEYYKRFDHEEVSSVSLIPENDPTTLFTSSGMQPMLQYLLGESYPTGAVRIVGSQKCFRGEDIEEVGNDRHTTFFEMLGNWSFGDYWKEDQLRWIFDFLVDELKLDPNKLYMTAFEGDKESGIPKDEETVEIWRKIFKENGIEAEVGERIFYYDATKNWWSRAGVPKNMPVGEPGGPDSEIFYEFDIEHREEFGEKCHPNCECGKYFEIANSVFMEFKKVGEGEFEKLPQKNIDFGGGLERMAAVVNNNSDMFEIDVFRPAIDKIEKFTNKKYENADKAPMQVIADHLRGVTFMIAEGLEPGNKQRGYVLRRLIRNAAAKMLLPLKSGHKIEAVFVEICNGYIDYYGELYFDVKKDKEKVSGVLSEELKSFVKTLEKGMKEALKGTVSAFDLYQTYGLPVEVIQDVFAQMGMGFDIDRFEKEKEKHQEASVSPSAGPFKGGLGDTSEVATWYHTLTHLLQQALRDVLGDEVKQAGSNITPERLRFDFIFGRALTEEEVEKVEKIVNEQKNKNLSVVMETMFTQEALDSGALAFFEKKYADKVNIYSIGNYSKEICGGPHVENTSEIKGEFKITKEKSSSAGVRRIRATVG